EVERQHLDRGRSGVGPGQGLARRDLVMDRIEAGGQLVVGDPRRPGGAATAERRGIVGLRCGARSRCAAIEAARGQRDPDEYSGAEHARLYHCWCRVAAVWTTPSIL